MGRSKVAIIEGTEPAEMVEKALRLIEAEKLFSPRDRALIKPNYVNPMPPSTGVTTDPRVVEALITFLKRMKVEEIIVGEGGSGDTGYAFDIVGIRDIVKRHGVRLVDLNKDKRVEIRIPNALALSKVGVAETLLDTPCVINVPKLKVHHMALVTVSMKNLMGFILPKSIMHGQLNEKIVDLASLIKPKINIVDGLVGSEVDEVNGRPVKMNLIIAGQDIVAVDAVAAAVMGIRPQDVKYLQLAEERGLGTANLDEIEVVGEQMETIRKRFELPSSFKRLKVVA